MKYLITAGPTREFIDTVRFITNRSTGKMGYAIAAQAAARGHEVRLITGPVSLANPDKVRVEKIVSAFDMLEAVESSLEWCDVLIMTAAVADWSPAQKAGEKLKKGADELSLSLKPTKDILKNVASRKGDRVFVGFAADDMDLLAEAERKLREKGLDMVVANDISQPDCGFEVDTNQVTIISKKGESIALPLMSKDDAAGEILNAIAAYQEL